jgi:hypothetical protein
MSRSICAVECSLMKSVIAGRETTKSPMREQLTMSTVWELNGASTSGDEGGRVTRGQRQRTSGENGPSKEQKAVFPAWLERLRVYRDRTTLAIQTRIPDGSPLILCKRFPACVGAMAIKCCDSGTPGSYNPRTIREAHTA